MTVVKATADKNDMINAITHLSDITIVPSTDDIVEHEADAIGIAYTFIKQFYNQDKL
jgi:Holliday junction resolvasome RuvABC endonuclease subunit